MYWWKPWTLYTYSFSRYQKYIGYDFIYFSTTFLWTTTWRKNSRKAQWQGQSRYLCHCAFLVSIRYAGSEKASTKPFCFYLSRTCDSPGGTPSVISLALRFFFFLKHIFALREPKQKCFRKIKTLQKCNVYSHSNIFTIMLLWQLYELIIITRIHHYICPEWLINQIKVRLCRLIVIKIVINFTSNFSCPTRHLNFFFFCQA